MTTWRIVPLGIVFVMTLMIGCSQDEGPASNGDADQHVKITELEKQVVSLKIQVKQLTTENKELKLTPSAMLVDVRAAVNSDDEVNSHTALKRLTDKFPDSPAAATGTDLVEGLVKMHKASAAEAARIAALGFKALKVSSTFTGEESTIKLRSIKISSRWTFDAYGDEWRYLESERGQKFVTARISVTSKTKNPKLMGLAVYKADGDKLIRIGSFGYEFSRWDDFASYLGNNADYRNDFAHSSSIPFSVGAPASLDQLKQPLYVIATKEGCFTRSEDRFGRPPVSYSSYSCKSLPASLTLNDFADGKLGVLKTIN